MVGIEAFIEGSWARIIEDGRGVFLNKNEHTVTFQVPETADGAKIWNVTFDVVSERREKDVFGGWGPFESTTELWSMQPSSPPETFGLKEGESVDRNVKIILRKVNLMVPQAEETELGIITAPEGVEPLIDAPLGGEGANLLFIASMFFLALAVGGAIAAAPPRYQASLLERVENAAGR